MGLSDAWVLWKKALECWDPKGSFRLGIKVSGESWDQTEARGGVMRRGLEM